jgi:hypothetical protein
LVVDGLGIAAAPWCIIGMIVILGTPRPLPNACAFLAGAVTAMVGLFLICNALFGDLDLTVHTTPASTTAAIQVAVGVVLLLWGAERYVRHRGREAGPPPTPKWLSMVDRIRPLIAYPIGLCMPNPILAVAGSLAILKANVSAAETVVALLIFIVVSLCTLIGPVVLFVRSPEQVAGRLQGWKLWLAAHSGDILTALLAFYGAVMAIEGLKDLV